MNVLMVCLGNICRSPLAEGILLEKAKEQGLKLHVDSAGTAAYHAGEPPDRRSREVAKKNGIDISRQRARKFEQEDFDRFDRIYVMDSSNYTDVMALARTPDDEKKVDMILNSAYPGKNLNVPDPYYGGKDGFDHVFKMLELSCEKIVEEINGKQPNKD